MVDREYQCKERCQKQQNHAERGERQERSTKGCNSKDLGSVSDLHGRFALCM